MINKGDGNIEDNGKVFKILPEACIISAFSNSFIEDCFKLQNLKNVLKPLRISFLNIYILNVSHS